MYDNNIFFSTLLFTNTSILHFLITGLSSIDSSEDSHSEANWPALTMNEGSGRVAKVIF